MIKMKQGGSLWQLSTFFGSEPSPRDGCEMLGVCLKSLFWIIVGVFVSGGVLGCYLGDLAGIITHGWLGYESLSFVVQGVSFILACILAFILFACTLAAMHYLFTKSDITETIRDNVKELHSSWKYKYCPLVKVIPKEGE